ncbi:hypothetical protein HYY75_11575, partial [bacterium]|nr:hypothetical protein [bacterium]
MNDPSSSISIRGKWLKFFLALLFFAGLPIGLIKLGWHFVSSQEHSRLINDGFHRLEKYLFRLKQEGSDVYFIQKELNQLFGRIRETDVSSESLKLSLKSSVLANLAFVNIYFFDKSGEIIFSNEKISESKSVIKKLFSALIEPELWGKDRLINQYRSLFKSFIAGIDPMELISQKSTLSKISLKEKPGFFYWNTFYFNPEPILKKKTKKNDEDSIFQGGVISTFLEENIPKNLALQHTIDNLNALSKQGEVYGCVDLEDVSLSILPFNNNSGFYVSTQQLKSAIVKMRSRF